MIKCPARAVEPSSVIYAASASFIVEFRGSLEYLQCFRLQIYLQTESTGAEKDYTGTFYEYRVNIAAYFGCNVSSCVTSIRSLLLTQVYPWALISALREIILTNVFFNGRAFSQLLV